MSIREEICRHLLENDGMTPKKPKKLSLFIVRLVATTFPYWHPVRQYGFWYRDP